MERKFRVNIVNCRHELPLLKELIKENQWEEVNQKDKKSDMIWLIPSKKEDNLEKILNVPAIFNRMPGLQLVSNKKTLGMIFQRLQNHYENDFNFAPLTFSLKSDPDQIRDYMSKCKDKTFIAKPEGGAEGAGIFLIKSFKELPAYSFQQSYIVQEYLDSPLLVDNKKFDLRIYVLVYSLDPLVAFIADEGLVRFCTEDYKKPDKDNLQNILMHLTNYSLNKFSDNYINCDNIQNQEKATKRTLSSLMQILKLKGIDADYLYEQIKDTCTKALIAIQPFVLREQEKQINIKKAKGKCFQILGFDIFIDSKLKAWLFEINDHPSLNINLEKESEQGFIKEVSEIDKFVKMKIVGEAIELMNTYDQERSEIEQYKGWIKLLPNIEFEGYDSFSKAKIIFDQLAGKKGMSMTLAKFTKLSKIKGMTSDKLMQPHYEILYKRTLSKCKTQQMSLEVFIAALEHLSETLYPFEFDKLDILINHIINNIKK